MKKALSKRWWSGLAALGLLAAIGWLMPNVPRPRVFERWPAPDSGWEPWQAIFQGVEYTRANFSKPRPLKVHAIRVDLTAPGVEVLVNPASPAGGSTFQAAYATEFLQQYHLQVVVSAGAFWPFARRSGTPVAPTGVAISDGVQWSKPVSNLHALAITRDRHVRLTTDQTALSDAWQAVGGNWITLRGGTNIAESLGLQPSSVGGHSADGRQLYWLIVDGRQPGWSEGVTASESADLMRSLGATEAIRFDDGSVVTLATAGGWTGARLVNRPSHPYITGVQRPIGSLLGIRARPLDPSRKVETSTDRMAGPAHWGMPASNNPDRAGLKSF